MKKIILSLGVLVMFLQVANVFLSNTIASGSVEAAMLQSEIEKIDEANAIIKTELLKYSSFTRVASRAAELGFNDTKRFMTVSSPLTVAVSSQTTTE